MNINKIIDDKNNSNIKRKRESRTSTNNKCSFNDCNKKLSLCAIKCKCNKLFCYIHSFYSKHNCNYDYKDEYKKKLIIQNKKIKIEKVSKI